MLYLHHNPAIDNSRQDQREWRAEDTRHVHSEFILCAALAAAVALGGCSLNAACPGKSPVRSIDHACLPAGTSPANIPVMAGLPPGDADYVEIAHVDSFTCEAPQPEASGAKPPADTASKDAQFADLQAKARAAGADAVINTRKLSARREGFINNPRTPFPSVMQGETKLQFYRGVAIKYVPGRRAAR